LEENIASALAYAFAFFSGIIVLVMERENKTVRFHALQSILWFAILAVVQAVLHILPFTGLLLGLVHSISVISWLALMVMALSGKKFKIPVIGDVAEAQVSK
jgi:uncharacterized membrane protein